MRRVLRLYRDAFAGLPAATWALSGIALVNRSGTMVLPFLTLWATDERGLDTTTAGWLFALYGVGALIGNGIGGRLADRLGPAPTMAGSMVVATCAFVVIAQLADPVALGAATLAAGAAVEAFRPANAAALVATCGPPLHRRAFALQRLAINAGMAIGPTAGGLLARVDYDLLFGVNAGACAATAALVVLLRRGLRAGDAADEAATGAAPTRGTSPLRDVRFLVFLTMTALTGVVFLQSISTMPLYFHDRYGLDEAEIGLLFAINPVMIVLFEMVLVHALRDRAPLLVIAAGAALGIGIMPLGESLPFAAFSVAVWTLGEMLESPTVPAWISARAGPARRGRYLGCYGVAFGVALVVAPIVGTQVYRSAGPDALWLGCAACAGLASLGYVRLHRARAA